MLKQIRDAMRLVRLRSARPYACCRLAWNLTQEDSDRADLYIERCRCGRRHRIMRAEPGVIGATGAPTGGGRT